MAVFKGFKPQGMQKIANKMGYAGRMEEFDSYLQQNPDKQREMIVYQQKAQAMARGGSVVKLQTGGQTQPRQLSQSEVPTQTGFAEGDTIGDVSVKMLENPALPEGGVTIPVGTQITKDQEIDTSLGQVEGTVGVPTEEATTTKGYSSAKTTAGQVDPALSATNVETALKATEAAQLDTKDPRAKVTAAEATDSSVSSLEAAQGKATLLENPMVREIQDGELISGVANAEKAAKFTEQIQAATATPSEKATVQGQLATLTDNFDASNPPAWAAGTLRAVQA